MVLGALGILMNLDVSLLNSAMPVVLRDSAHFSPVIAAQLAVTTGGFYRVASSGDLLVWLGDAIPVGWSGSLFLVSPGDVVLAVAMAIVIVYGMGLDPSIGRASRASG